MVAATPPLDVRLVEEALAILAEEGLEGLTLRRIAQRAGVSHGAPLRHYKSLADLLSEVAARGFEWLAAEVAEAASGVSAREGIAAAGRAYVATAVAHPELFALMFRPHDLDFTNPSLLAASTEAFEQLVGLVRGAQQAGFQPERETRVLAGSVWASVHGLATLWSQGALPNVLRGASLEDVLETSLAFLLHPAPGGHR